MSGQTILSPDAQKLWESLSRSTIGMRHSELYKALHGKVKVLGPDDVPCFDEPDESQDDIWLAVGELKTAGLVEVDSSKRVKRVKEPVAIPSVPPTEPSPRPAKPATPKVPRPRSTPESSTSPAKEPTSKAISAKGGNVPKPKVPTREPRNQAEHMSMIARSTKLTEYPNGLLVAMRLHVYMGMKHKAGFGAPTNVARSLLADMTGLSERTAGKAIDYAIEHGFYRRIDSAKGGKGKGSAAAYVPVVPDWD